MKARVSLAVDKSPPPVNWDVRSPTLSCELTRAFTRPRSRAFAHTKASPSQSPRGFQETVTRARGLTLFKIFNATGGFTALPSGHPPAPCAPPQTIGAPLGPSNHSSAPFGLGHPLRLHPASDLAGLAAGAGTAGYALDLLPCHRLDGFQRHQGFASPASSPVRCSGQAALRSACGLRCRP